MPPEGPEFALEEVVLPEEVEDDLFPPGLKSDVNEGVADDADFFDEVVVVFFRIILSPSSSPLVTSV